MPGLDNNLYQIIISQLHQFRANTHIGDFFDILVVGLVIYYVLSWFRRRASPSLFIRLGIIASLYALARLLNMYITSLLFHAGLAAMLMVLVIIFQSDIRRAFESFNGWRFWGKAGKSSLGDPTIADILVNTVSEFAQKNVGALIVLQGKEAVGRHVRGGTPVDGEISNPILYSIFDHHSPGHDGAVIIDQGRIDRLGVLLPLSDNLKEVGKHGTRHTAALGLSEHCDAMAIVVSEEQGTISIAHQGKLRRVDSLALLKKDIENFSQTSPVLPKPRISSRLIRENIGFKLLSLVLACLLWFMLAYRVETLYRTFEVPIEYRNMPSNLIIADGLPTHAVLTMSGPERVFTLNTTIGPVSIDMSHIKEGDNQIPLTSRHVTIPSGLELIQMEPGMLQLKASKVAEAKLPVRVVTRGAMPAGYKMAGMTAVPDSVTVLLDGSAWRKIGSIPTEPVTLDTLRNSTVWRLQLAPPKGVSLKDSTHSTVRVKARVKPVKAGSISP
ncbi:MAG: hypothetical protein GF401_06980 [Chitinivibrionales bacterium]|nr:hypothetical protein [Chitinivibrionales bacterium]